jgi:outer membrane receptor protein involved in Fe transport
MSLSFLEYRPGSELRRHIPTLIFICFSLDPVAAEWLIQPDVSLITEYNDNKQLTALPHDGVLGSQLDIKGKLGMQTEKTEVSIIPRARFSKYSGNDNLDSNDYFLDLGSSFATEKIYWHLNGKYVRDTLLTGELEDAGLVKKREKRRKMLLSPALVYEFSERVNLKTEIDLTQVKYKDAGLSELVNYDFKTVAIALATETGEKGKLNMLLNISLFEAANVGDKSDHVSMAVMYKRNLTDSLESEVLFGVRKSNFNSEQDGDKQGIIFKLEINKEHEQTKWKAALSRTIDPSGFGLMIQKDRFYVNVIRPMTDQSQALVSLSLLKNKGLESNTVDRNRKYYQFDARLRWQVTDDWLIQGGYRYRRNESGRLANVVDSNAIMYEFIYRPPSG